MSIRARLILLAFVGVFVIWPWYWATQESPQAMRAKARTAQADDCRRDALSRVVSIKVSVSKYPENWRHMVDARHGRNTQSDGTTVVNDGLKWPTVLRKNDVGEDQRRQAAFRLAGVTKTKPGKARDEYPPAEGRSTDAADIRYVAKDPNARQGASMGGQLRPYCNRQRYKLVAVP
jgi:hypothetical protein